MTEPRWAFMTDALSARAGRLWSQGRGAATKKPRRPPRPGRLQDVCASSHLRSPCAGLCPVSGPGRGHGDPPLRAGQQAGCGSWGQTTTSQPDGVMRAQLAASHVEGGLPSAASGVGVAGKGVSWALQGTEVPSVFKWSVTLFVTTCRCAASFH